MDHFSKITTGEDTQKGEKVFYRGQKIKGDDELKNSDDDLVMALMMVDRAINQWQLLKVVDRVNSGRVISIDQIKKKDEIYFVDTGNFDMSHSNNWGW